MLLADDVALVADSEKLHRLVSKFGRVCEYAKVMEYLKRVDVCGITVSLNGEFLEGFVTMNLGSHMAKGGGMEIEVSYIVN